VTVALPPRGKDGRSVHPGSDKRINCSLAAGFVPAFVLMRLLALIAPELFFLYSALDCRWEYVGVYGLGDIRAGTKAKVSSRELALS
jgi:hypothetical protein